MHLKPRDEGQETRTEVEVPLIAYRQMREAGGAWVPVRDQITGNQILLRSASCGASCCCDAEWKPTEKKEDNTP